MDDKKHDAREFSFALHGREIMLSSVESVGEVGEFKSGFKFEVRLISGQTFEYHNADANRALAFRDKIQSLLSSFYS